MQVSDTMTIDITTEDPRNPLCSQLIAELSAELGALYADDGAGRFAPEDVIGRRAAFVVAWLNGVPVGCGALRPMPDATMAEIKRMFVRKWARRRGISHRILATLETLATEMGYQAVQLETGTLQQEAIGLYESAGYQRISCHEPYHDDPLSVCYEKRLVRKM